MLPLFSVRLRIEKPKCNCDHERQIYTDMITNRIELFYQYIEFHTIRLITQYDLQKVTNSLDNKYWVVVLKVCVRAWTMVELIPDSYMKEISLTFVQAWCYDNFLNPFLDILLFLKIIDRQALICCIGHTFYMPCTFCPSHQTCFAQIMLFLSWVVTNKNRKSK